MPQLTETAAGGKVPRMRAVRADTKRRVVIPGARPGDVFDVQRQSDARFVPVRLHRANEAPEMGREACLDAMDRLPLNMALSWEQLRRITREPRCSLARMRRSTQPRVARSIGDRASKTVSERVSEE